MRRLLGAAALAASLSGCTAVATGATGSAAVDTGRALALGCDGLTIALDIGLLMPAPDSLEAEAVAAGRVICQPGALSLDPVRDLATVEAAVAALKALHKPAST